MSEQSEVIKSAQELKPGKCRGRQNYPQERISKWMCEQIEVIESGQDLKPGSVEAVKIIPQVRRFTCLVRVLVWWRLVMF